MSTSVQTLWNLGFLVHYQSEGCQAVFGLHPFLMYTQHGKVTQGTGVETESLLKGEHLHLLFAAKIAAKLS